MRPPAAPSARSAVALILTLAAVTLAAGSPCPAFAFWSSDPSLNLAIADRTSEQVVPKIAATSDGGCYIGWMDLASGNYDVYLQRLDASGNELWPHNGILVSNHPQDTWITDWDLIADSNDHCVLVFNDIRAGGDWDIYAYRVSPAGAEEWGADGIALSNNNDFEASPRVCEATDGDFVFVWGRQPDVGDGTARMQRVSPAGVVRLAADGVVIASATGETPGFPEVIPSIGGDVIVSWIRDVHAPTSPRHLRARRFNAAGAPVWASYVNVYDAVALPIAYWPVLLSDGAGGAILGWHRSAANMYNSMAQHLNAAGVEQWPHNGVTVSTNSTRHHLDPTFAYRPSTGETFVFWNERNNNQDQWGIYGQKLTSIGSRAWGAEGIIYLPVDGTYKWLPECRRWSDGAMVFYGDEPGGLYNQDRVRGFRVDAAGAMVWPGSPIAVSSHLSSKVHMTLALTSTGTALMAWEDDRMGTPDIYGQNVNADGTLGVTATSVARLGAGETAFPAAPSLAVTPNPFRESTRIELIWPASARPASLGAADARLEIMDVTGRRVRVLALDEEARQAGELRWDGRDASGRPLPGGVYYCRATVDGRQSEARAAVITR